jgi:hypothetical protein
LNRRKRSIGYGNIWKYLELMRRIEIRTPQLATQQVRPGAKFPKVTVAVMARGQEH